MAPPPAKKVKTAATSSTVQPPQPTVQPSGDALDDDFALEPGFAPSDDDHSDFDNDADAFPEDSGAIPALGDDDDELLDEAADVNDSGSGSEPARKKRRAVTSADEKEGSNQNGSNQKKSGKEKGKAKKEKRKAKIAELGAGDDEGERLGLLPSAYLVDRLADKQRKALPKMSNIEMDDLRITESFLHDTSAVTERKSLETFIRQAFPTLSSTLAKVPKKEGCPRVLVIAGAALRVADLCREVKVFKTKEIDVAKLFSKHFKLAEHAEYLDKTKVGIAVGTPNRIGKLLSDTESLHLTHLSHIILDTTHLDAKKRSLVDMPEAREDLFTHVLGAQSIMDRLKEGKVKIVLY